MIHVSYGLAFFASHTHTHTNLTTTVRKQRNKTKTPHTRTKHDRRHTQTHTPKHRYAITVTLILTIRFFKLHQNRHSCGRHSSQLTMYVEKPTYYGVVVFRYRKRWTSKSKSIELLVCSTQWIRCQRKEYSMRHTNIPTSTQTRTHIRNPH